jgi:hypothetical protein
LKGKLSALRKAVVFVLEHLLIELLVEFGYIFEGSYLFDPLINSLLMVQFGHILYQLNHIFFSCTVKTIRLSHF